MLPSTREVDRISRTVVSSPAMRIARLALVFAVALTLLLDGVPAQAHRVKVTADGTVTGTSVDAGTMTIDVRIHIKNRARKRRDIGCDFSVHRVDNDMVVATGFVGAFIRGGRSKNISTQVFAPDPGTTEFYVVIDHCHTY